MTSSSIHTGGYLTPSQTLEVQEVRGPDSDLPSVWGMEGRQTSESAVVLFMTI